MFRALVGTAISLSLSSEALSALEPSWNMGAYAGTGTTFPFDKTGGTIPGDREGGTFGSFDKEFSFSTPDGSSYASASLDSILTTSGKALHLELQATFTYTLSATEQGTTQAGAYVQAEFRFSYGNNSSQLGHYKLQLEMEPLAGYSVFLSTFDQLGGRNYGGGGSLTPTNDTISGDFFGYKTNFILNFSAYLSAAEKDLPPAGTRTETSSFVIRFDIDPVPEPTSAALLAMGICFFGIRRPKCRQ